MRTKNLPNRLFQILKRRLGQVKRIYWKFKFRKMTNEQIFTNIYSHRLWGSARSGEFNSGTGSHDAKLVETYVQAVTEYFGPEIAEMSAIDIGCGDFIVGNQLHQYFKGYLAIDVNPQLIEHNKAKFKSTNLEFRFLDATTNQVPESDVIFIRQVLQHLSNRDIEKLLSNLPKHFKYLIVTEHLPAHIFMPNLDIETGHQTRITKNSGVILHEPPFKLINYHRRVLCETIIGNGKISTFLYFFENN